MHNRSKEKFWKMYGDEWRLMGIMHSWEDEYKILARLKNALGSTTEFIGTYCNFLTGTEAPEITTWSADLWDDFPSVEIPQKIMVEHLYQTAKDMLTDAIDLCDLFGDDE